MTTDIDAAIRSALADCWSSDPDILYRAIWQASRRAALIEAAGVCEAKVRRDAEYGGRFGGYGPFDGDKTGPECAAALRELAGK